jgi:hypothetical protein
VASARGDRRKLLCFSAELGELPQYGARAREGLDTTALSARAERRIRRGIHANMANFCAEAVRPGVELVANHEPAANPGLERHEQESLVLLTVPVQSFGPRAGGGAVFDRDRTM